MSNLRNIIEVEAMLLLSPIERGMNEIQNAKQEFCDPMGLNSGSQNHRVVLTNGTGSINKDTPKNAQLERRISRA